MSETEVRDEAAPATPVAVWDLPTRLFHWSLVTLICISWYCGETGVMRWHMLSGQAILTLLLFRLAWGLVGSQSARFSDFVKGPGAVLGYARGLLAGRPEPWIGHNPLGGWMVIALLMVLLIQAGSGLFANDDIFSEGPLANLVSKETSDNLTRLHKANFNLLLVLAALHIAAAFYYLLVKGENLIRPMITGRKWLASRPALQMRSPLLALILLGLSAVLIWLLVTRL